MIKLRKLLLILAFACICNIQPIAANTESAGNFLTESSKNYGISADNMFLTSLSVLNSLKYDVLEMQSKSGYILFRANSKDYILTVTSLSPVTSNIKILPANSVFSTGTIVQSTIFKALDADKLNIMKKVKTN